MADGHDPPQEPAGGKWELSALIALLFPPHLLGLYWLNQAGNMNVVGLSEIRTQEEEGKMGALLGAVDSWGSQEGCHGPFRPSGRNRGLPLRRRRGQGPHLAKRWEPRGFSRVAAAPASPLFSPACWELGFQAWAQSTCPELSAQG